MRRFDSDWWSTHAAGIPTKLVPASGMELAVGSQKAILRHPLPAHTSGDLWVYLPATNIVATGDLVFNRYYPFMDQPEGGTSIAGIITAVRQLEREYPGARFLPGHGPMATATDLTKYADYLESLSTSVRRAHQHHQDEQQAAKEIDLSRWQLSILPSFHHKQMIWATAANNVRWAFRLEGSKGVDQL
jgi:glyoxylase-like metal-dependent hydrolase (beta-lactamase superfamily II)